MKAKFKLNIHPDGVSIQKRFLWFFYDLGVGKKWTEMTKEERKLAEKVIQDSNVLKLHDVQRGLKETMKIFKSE